MTSLRPRDKPELLEPLKSKQEGTKVVLECKWLNHTRVSWLRNEVPIFSTKDMTISEARSSCTLTIHRANKEHNGQYMCTASNLHGKSSTYCQLTVVAAFEVGLKRRLPGKSGRFSKLNFPGAQSQKATNQTFKKDESNCNSEVPSPKINGVLLKPKTENAPNNVGRHFTIRPTHSATTSHPPITASPVDGKQTQVKASFQSGRQLSVSKTTPTTLTSTQSSKSRVFDTQQSNSNPQAPMSSQAPMSFQAPISSQAPTTSQAPMTSPAPKSSPATKPLSSQVSWSVKKPAAAYKPVSFEIEIPGKPKDSSCADSQEKIASQSAEQLPVRVTKQSPGPSSKVAAVALLSNKLQAAQQQENAFMALREGLRPVSRSTVTHQPKSTAKPTLDKSVSEDLPSNKRELKPTISFESFSYTEQSPRKVTHSASSSTSDVSTEVTNGKTPPSRSTSTGSTIKDRVALFNSQEPVTLDIPYYLKRSDQELSQPSVPKYNDTKSTRNTLKAAEASQSEDSLSGSSKSYHTASSTANERKSASTSQSAATSGKLHSLRQNTKNFSSVDSKGANLSFNHDKTKGTDMKLKVSPFSSGLKTSAFRTSLPVFTSKLRNHYGRQGGALKLQCKVDGEPKPVISWHKEGKPLSSNHRIQIYEKNGVHYFEITDSVKEDSGRYTAEAVNSKGSVCSSADVEIAGKKLTTPEQKTPSTKFTKKTDSSASVSDNITKQVDEFHSEVKEAMAELDGLSPHSSTYHHTTHSNHTVTPPSFTLHLKDCEVEEGERLDLICTAQGEDPGLSHCAPQFVKPLEDDFVTEGDSVTISCQSTHGDHSSAEVSAPKFTQELSNHVLTEGDSLTISVLGPHDSHSPTSPTFVQQLQDHTVTEGDSVTIECKTRLSSSAAVAPVFVEQLEDVEATEGDSLTLECLSPSSKLNSSSTQSTRPVFVKELQDQQVEEGNSVTLLCHGPVSPHKPDSQSASNNAIETEFSPPKFVKQLEDEEVNEGDEVTISCQTPANKSANSNQKPVFVKSLSSDVEVEEGESVIISCTSQQTQQTPSQQEQFSPPKFVKELSDAEINEGDSLIISCGQISPIAASVTSHTDSSTDEPVSQSAQLPPAIAVDLTDLEVTVGQKAELVMETTGSLPMDIVWVHNEDELAPDDPDYVQISEGHVHRLLISAVFPEDSGTYICEAYNDYGEADSACELHVLDNVTTDVEPLDQKPQILQSLPEALTITDDSTLELVCKISNVKSEDVRWNKNQRMARKGSRFQATSEGQVFSYRISNCMSIDKGVYTVTGSNEFGEVSCSCTVSYSNDNQYRRLPSRQSTESQRSATDKSPKFTKKLRDLTVTEMEDAVLECKVEASPVPTVQWLCNNNEIKPSNTFKMTVEGDTAKLTIKDTQLSDQGSYAAVATNSAGTDSSSCLLSVQKATLKPRCTVPEAPCEKPTVIDVSSQGAIVTWKSSPFDGGSAILGYKIEMCKASLLKISLTKYWKTLTDLCKSMSYRVTSMAPSHEFVFRVSAVNIIGEGPPSEISEPVIATDPRESCRSISLSTLGDNESIYSDYPESEYDPDLDEAFMEHDVIITKDRKMEDHYNIIEELGKGKFGLVYLVVDSTTSRQWAAKKIKCRPSQKPDIMNEIEVMNTLRHPKLVRLWEVFDHGKEMVLIQEYVGGGELFERIVDDDFELKESDCIRFMKQICEGINYMHSKSVIHLDLKPENVMCVSKHSNQIKLIDFGLARKFKPGDNMKILFGTPEFVAPEVISYDPVGFTTDMWSIGVITYVLLSGLSPFMGDNDSETLSNVTMTQWDFEDEAFDEISESAKDFISKLLVKQKSNRLSAADAIQHPWLFDTIKQQQSQTLSKSKSKMKKFLARRKWQKTFKAMVAIKRMRSSFSKLNSLDSPLSPSGLPKIIDQDVDKAEISAPSPTEEGSAPTPIQSPVNSETYEDVFQSKSAVTPTNTTDQHIFEYNSDNNNHKFYEEEAGKDENGTVNFEVDRDAMSDTIDSGYEGRKSTREITDVEDCLIDVSQPVFSQTLPKEVHVIEGDCSRFDVEVVGNPVPSVNWFRDSEIVQSCDKIEFDCEGSKHSLIIRNISFTDDAEYECRATNENGESSTFCELFVMSTA